MHDYFLVACYVTSHPTKPVSRSVNSLVPFCAEASKGVISNQSFAVVSSYCSQKYLSVSTFSWTDLDPPVVAHQRWDSLPFCWWREWFSLEIAHRIIQYACHQIKHFTTILCKTTRLSACGWARVLKNHWVIQAKKDMVRQNLSAKHFWAWNIPYHC